MKKIVFLYLVFLVGCNYGDQDSKYLRWVGDSKFDPEVDSSTFKLCNDENLVKQYFHFDKGLQIEGEKIAILNRFEKEYQPIETAQSGWVRIRFLVNCKGETGRFRVIGSDEEYQEQMFDEAITNQLIKITKSLKGWAKHEKDEKPQDYYQYLIFKIDNGAIKDIMP